MLLNYTLLNWILPFEGGGGWHVELVFFLSVPKRRKGLWPLSHERSANVSTVQRVRTHIFNFNFSLVFFFSFLFSFACSVVVVLI